MGEAGSLQKRFVAAIHSVLGIQGRSVLGCEHETPVSIQGTYRGPAANFSSS